MTALAWYATGTVAVTNGSPIVTGSGTSWTANADAGQGFIGPDHSVYEIASVDSDTLLALRTNYRGGTVGSGGAYVIAPFQGYTRSAAQELAALMLAVHEFTDLVFNDNDIIQQKLGALATRSPIQYFTDLCDNLTEFTVASATTCDIGAATSPKVLISGTITISSLGAEANCLRLVRFDNSLTLAHSSSLILPASADIVTAAGDTAIFLSDAAGHWRCWTYWPAANFAGGGLNPYQITFRIEGGGAIIRKGEKADVFVDYDCTITKATALADGIGSIAIDLWKVPYASYPPDVSNSITASAPVTISNDNKSQDSTLTGWNTAVNKGDVIRPYVKSCTFIKAVSVTLTVTRTP